MPAQGEIPPDASGAATARPLRVALVHEEFGLENSLARDATILARELVKLGVDVHFYCDPAQRTAAVDGVTFHDVEPATRRRSRLGYAVEYGSFALAATRALRRARGTYDVVHVNECSGWEHDVVRVHAVHEAEQKRWPQRGGRDYKAATVRATLAPVLWPQVAVARTIERLQFRPQRFRRILAVTDEVRDDLERVHGVPRQLVEVVPCGIDAAAFAHRNGSGSRSALGLDPDAEVLLFVGHDFKRKGLDRAIAALARLGSQAHLVVVGGGSNARYVEDARRAGVADRVHFVGATDAPQTFYREAQVLVLPTREDVWGVAILEGMAAGVPVVTTAAAGAAAVVREAGAGVVLDDGAVGELETALAALLAAPERRREMGARGREAAMRFTFEEQARRTLAVYRELAA